MKKFNTPINVALLSALTAMSASCRSQQTPPQVPPFVPMFSASDCQSIVQYWTEPGRLTSMPPSNIKELGLFRPHITVQGSRWLLRYERLSQQLAPPTQNGIADSSKNQDWNRWIQEKFAYDYAQAAILCEKFNQLAGVPTDLVGIHLNAPSPGACPTQLAQIAGDPPAFAAAAPIIEYKVHFHGLDLMYQDHVVVPAQYPYYRFDQGLNSEGRPVKSLSSSHIDRLFQMAGADKKVEDVFNAVSTLEGGFDAVNTYDTGFVSAGFIQFASLREGGGSLGEMLLQYKADDPLDFNNDFHRFGIDVTPQGILAVVDPSTGIEVQGMDANLEIIQDPRLIAVFQGDGLKSDAYDSEQIKSAISQFYPAHDSVTFTLPNGSTTSVIVGDIIHSEAGLATLTDRKVNTGKLGNLSQVLSDVANEHKINQPNDLSQYEFEIIQKMRYRRNYLTDSHLSQPIGSPLYHKSSESSKNVNHGGNGSYPGN